MHAGLRARWWGTEQPPASFPLASRCSPTAYRQLPVVSRGNCRGVAEDCYATRRQTVSPKRPVGLLVSRSNIGICTCPGFCSVSFLRAAPCYALTKTGNWCPYLRGYLGAFWPAESAKREVSNPPNRDRQLPLRKAGLPNRERIIAYFLPYRLAVNLLLSKKGPFLLRNPRRGARPLPDW